MAAILYSATYWRGTTTVSTSEEIQQTIIAVKATTAYEAQRFGHPGQMKADAATSLTTGKLCRGTRVTDLVIHEMVRDHVAHHHMRVFDPAHVRHRHLNIELRQRP